jgi:hypothetical protein
MATAGRSGRAWYTCQRCAEYMYLYIYLFFFSLFLVSFLFFSLETRGHWPQVLGTHWTWTWTEVPGSAIETE